MSSMEPEARNFLVKIANSLAVSLFWLIINTSVGIGFNFAFFSNKPNLGNYIFYAWFIVSLVFLIIYLKRKWEL